MIDDDGSNAPLENSAAGGGNPFRADPLLESWLRRTLPAAGGRRARIEQFVRIYSSHESPECAGSESPRDELENHACSSVYAIALMRRGLSIALADAGRNEAAGRSVVGLPLRLDMLAALEAETWGAFLVSFQLVELLGRAESGEIDSQQRALLGLVAPLAALITGRQAAAVIADLVEDAGTIAPTGETGVPGLRRYLQTLPARAGRVNALALEALLGTDLHDALAALMGRASSCLRAIKEPRLAAAGRQAVGALERAVLWLESGKERDVLEAGARRLAMTLARGLQLALLCEHAQWMLDRDGDRRGFAAALRYSRVPVDLMHEVDPALDRQLLS